MVSVCQFLVFYACMFQACSLRLAKESNEELGASQKAGCKPVDNSLCRQSSQKQKKSRPLLITANGGSGTHTIKTIFATNGIALGHERVGKNGSVSWAFAVDVTRSNFVTTPGCNWLNSPNSTFNHVVHLARCPRDVVSALQSHATCSLKYIRDTLHLNFKDSELRSTKFLMSAWLEWNKHIEGFAESRYRIDEFLKKDTIMSIANLSGFNPPNNVVFPTAHVNHRHHSDLTWAALRAADKGLAQQLEFKARQYGFPESCFKDVIELPDFPQGPDTMITTDEDSIIWFWNNSAVQNKFEKNEKLFENIESARQYLNAIREKALHDLLLSSS